MGWRALLSTAILATTAAVGCGTLLSLDGSESAPDNGNTPGDGKADAEGADGMSTSDGAGPAADGGGPTTMDAAPASCGENPNCERVVFVTSALFTALDVAIADTKCAEAAAAPGVAPRVQGRTFNAWTSAGSATAASKLVHGTAPYVLSDGKTVVANDWTDLTDGTVLVPIALTELGSAPTAGIDVWTGTHPSGTATTANCNDWKSTGNPSSPVVIIGVAGSTTAVNGKWSESQTSFDCKKTARIYCFEH